EALSPEAQLGPVHRDELVPGTGVAVRPPQGYARAKDDDGEGGKESCGRARPRRGSPRRCDSGPTPACTGPHTDARPAARPRATASGKASTSLATSSGVLVHPTEKRSTPRASASGTPIASRTCEGWGTPAWYSDPVEHATPAASSSYSSESPSQP